MGLKDPTVRSANPGATCCFALSMGKWEQALGRHPGPELQ